MTRWSLNARILAVALAAIMLCTISTGLRAQDDARCVCDHYTFRIDPALTCKVDVCWQFSPDGPTFCRTIGPGDELRVPCPVWEAGFQTCTGFLAIISNSPVISICTNGVAIPGHCCVRACRGTDRQGCPTITIEPWICVGSPC